ncbi:hypothetical protein OCU04_004600 [Sclerotinia nivalis]|uniref:Ankyrin repeat protein n=1 Tax=Sclerotinia nivalis TaxID=352851 RepID=A0A9X0AQR9_9HELO|nr:hypothetical protein OCU04_004600 [Sclerotinia nivalis]
MQEQRMKSQQRRMEISKLLRQGTFRNPGYVPPDWLLNHPINAVRLQQSRGGLTRPPVAMGNKDIRLRIDPRYPAIGMDRRARGGLSRSGGQGGFAGGKFSLQDVEFENGNTALHLAVANSDEPMALILLENGADMEPIDPEGCKPLYIAVKSGFQSMAKQLLDYGADPDSYNSKTKYTALRQIVEATIIDFFEFGEQETFTSPIYNLIYGSGISNMMITADEAQMKNGKTKAQSKDPKFRWYHLPANNVRAPPLLRLIMFHFAK